MSGNNDDPMARFQPKAAERAAVIDQIARMLWESGEALADTEGGSMPTWDQIREAVETRIGDADFVNACFGWWLDHKHKAEAILALDAAQSLTLATFLIENAKRYQERTELDLWRKIERAKGFEAGSLTGAPGVKQKVAL